MHTCVYCKAPAERESVNILESTDGPVALSRFRCLAEFTHFWDEGSDPIRLRAAA
jgi:hypothetical protein